MIPQNLPHILLPSGYRIYWENNTAGGRTYYSDEIGDGVMVWDTCLVSRGTLEAVLALEGAMAKLREDESQ